MEHYEEQDYSSEKFSAQVWKKILSKVFKRKKNITAFCFGEHGFCIGDVCLCSSCIIEKS